MNSNRLLKSPSGRGSAADLLLFEDGRIARARSVAWVRGKRSDATGNLALGAGSSYFRSDGTGGGEACRSNLAFGASRIACGSCRSRVGCAPRSGVGTLVLGGARVLVSRPRRRLTGSIIGDLGCQSRNKMGPLPGMILRHGRGGVRLGSHGRGMPQPRPSVRLSAKNETLETTIVERRVIASRRGHHTGPR